MNGFERSFGIPPEAEGVAPGRVNLLGEHTDYNEGLVLPTTIPRHTRVAIGSSPDGRSQFVSSRLSDTESDSGATARFESYLEGCIEVLRAMGYLIPALLVRVDSDVPMGSGLSSSAALEVAMLRALRQRYALALDDVELALAGQRAEIEYAGVRCGILDQMAVSLGAPGSMLFLDTRSLERQLLPLPEGAALLVLDSGLSRSLGTSGYNERRSECERAASALGLKSLRDVADVALACALPPPLDRRARHVITENERVREAVRGVDAPRFGALMNASHASLRDDYEVSVPAVDRLVEALTAERGVFGAKLTGAGFGGACVALVRSGDEERIARHALATYARSGYLGSRLV